jgi:hypothetical protein
MLESNVGRWMVWKKLEGATGSFDCEINLRRRRSSVDSMPAA